MCLFVCRWKMLHTQLFVSFLLLTGRTHVLEFVLTAVHHTAEEIILLAVSFLSQLLYLRCTMWCVTGHWDSVQKWSCCIHYREALRGSLAEAAPCSAHPCAMVLPAAQAAQDHRTWCISWYHTGGWLGWACFTEIPSKDYGNLLEKKIERHKIFLRLLL